MSIFRRSESKQDDDARTTRLLDGLETAYEARTGDACSSIPLDDFEETVLFGVGYDQRNAYPPAGHTYPKRGR
ncbi:hypothetical protein OS965_32820 [Streptomyces sp. H27-G5]|uniref:hypothetical protein n=1 Tax=Streptomyces sp. H27-G5 TaxID=2996698 RepID=UPI00226F3AA4|nr:hypothetical protein [Streptomyces sp. H27-G5]MCY0922873.1 hypothetical protein [Streptomyces sp. H27-G5]